MAVRRKTVTVLFADVADSTGLGERLDPESVRRLLSRWFDEARAIVEKHGGTVEKFIGDALMAVFGVPQLHEDDALRAVRAASELRTTIARLNDDFAHEHGLTLAVRIGVNTGEVVAGGDTNTLVTGDAVNVAKRLEEAAGEGEVLVGETTHALARGAGRFEALGPVAAKGKTAAVLAWRVVGVDGDASAFERRADTPLVGRAPELEHLRRAYARAAYERTCYLFTLLGPAGIGKSRLAGEFFAEVADEATVAVGRCLPYGEGITFWPLRQALRELGGEDEIARLVEDIEDGELVIDRLSGVVHAADVASQETFWAVRKVFEAAAGRRPLVVCFEDIHWAEPTFLDLIEYLAGWIRGAPLFLICLARPEFLDHRPSWLAGQETAASLTLSPLSADESDVLLGALGISSSERERIVAAAEGNPLYVEQMAAMVAEGGSLTDLFTMPPTIQALLAARLDRLGSDERAAIERAAVCGKEFWLDAIAELSPPDERARLGSTLLSLVRKELIRPHRTSTRPVDAFRFGHALIRDAAYAAIPKEARTSLHERFADWVEAIRGPRAPELEEIIGYHLEQAFRARSELGPLDEDARSLGERASALLGGAGHRALERHDIPAARNLLERSAALLGTDAPARPTVLIDLGITLAESGDPGKAAEVLGDAVELAEADGDEGLAARARIERSGILALVDPAVQADELQEAAEAAVDVFSAAGDDEGLTTALCRLAEVYWMRCRYEQMQAALERALLHAERSGSRRQLSRIRGDLCRVAVVGPRPVAEGVELCRATHERARGDGSVTSVTDALLAVLEAMRGDAEAARELYRRSARTLLELGLTIQFASQQMYAGWAELIAGDPLAAERELRVGYELLEQMGETSYLSTTAGFLARALYDAGRYGEAREMTEVGERAASADDLGSQVLWRGVRAKVDAREGDTVAVAVAQAGVRLADETDFLNLRAGAYEDLSETFRLLDRAAESQRSLDASLRLYESKGNVAVAGRLRARAAVSADASPLA